MRNSQPTFAGGEVSDAVAARWDVAKYGTALARARNTLGLPQGGQYIRPGLLFGDQVKHHEQKAVLLPFVFSAGDSYAIEMTPGLMRLYYRGGLVTRPRLTITAITRGVTTTVTAPDHGYEPGMTVTFDGVEGMVEINGLRGEVVSVTDDDTFVVAIDSRLFSPFTGDTGGVPGSAEGGSGGEPPPPPPGEDPPPPEIPDEPIPPPYVPPRGGDMYIREEEVF